MDRSFFETDGKKDLDSDNDSDENTRDSVSQNERRIGIAEQLYKYSTQPGIEVNMVEEGTVEALDDFAHMDDPRALDCCAAVLANLTVAEDLCVPMLDSGVVTDVILPLHLKPHLTEPAKRGLAVALYRFSLIGERVLSVFRECGDAITHLMKNEDEETKVCAVASLVNVTGAMIMSRSNNANSAIASIAGDERQRIVEVAMPFVRELTSSGSSHIRVAVAKSLKNFSLYENARITMIEAGVCESILKLTSYPELEEYRIDIITAVANLTNAVEGRERMIRDGIVSCVVKLGNSSDSDENKKLVACAMANLTGVSDNMIGHVVMNGAAKSLVSLCAIVDRFDDADTIDIRVAAGLANLTVHTVSILKLISSDVHTSFMLLAKQDGVPTLREAFDLVDSDGHGSIDISELANAMHALGVDLTQQEINALVERFDHDDSGVLEFQEFKLLVKYQAEHGQALQLHTRQVLVAIGLCNLLSDFNAHEVMVESNVIECLRHLTEINDKKVNVYCAKALSNLVANPAMRLKLATSGVFDEWIELIDSMDLECCKVCGNALVHQTFDAMYKTDIITHMIDRGILQAVDKMISMKDSSLYRYCATIICNLVADEVNHTKLYDFGILKSIDRLTVESIHVETMIRCGAALERLSSNLKNESIPDLINSLSLLLSSSSDSLVTHYISVAFFELSARPDCQPLLAKDECIHKLLISMMRGAPGETQIHGAKALCNLTCDEACAGLLLKSGNQSSKSDGGVADGDVSNLNSHVSDFVVIAILRTNSPLIKEICAQSLFNLLHHEKYRNEMVETGVLWAIMKLSKLESRQTQNICAKVLFNFSCYENMQQKIMEHGVSRLLSIATVKNSNGVEIEDSQTKQFCAGALCNLAFRPEAGSLYAKGGAIDFMKELMDVEDDENEMYCATILFNLSHCDIASRVTLVQENAVPLLVNLSRSEKERTIIAMLGSSYNISLCVEARKDMVLENIAPAIFACIKRTDNVELVSLGLAALYHLTCCETGHDGESCAHVVASGCAAYLVETFEKYSSDALVSLLSSRILMNLCLENCNHAKLVESGALNSIRVLQGIDGEERRNSKKMISALANTSEILKLLVEHETFDTYCHQILESKDDDDLELLSQVFLNIGLNQNCAKPLVNKVRECGTTWWRGRTCPMTTCAAVLQNPKINN